MKRVTVSSISAKSSKGRLWYLGNFLLLKHNRSYISMFVREPGKEQHLHWWPEYELELGTPINQTVPENIDRLRHGSGVYFREFRRGLVLVNPNKSARTVRLAGRQKYQSVNPVGGGLVDRRGRPAPGSLGRFTSRSSAHQAISP